MEVNVMCFDIIFFQAEDGIRDIGVTGVQTCALPICPAGLTPAAEASSPEDTLRRPPSARPASTRRYTARRATVASGIRGRGGDTGHSSPALVNPVPSGAVPSHDLAVSVTWHSTNGRARSPAGAGCGRTTSGTRAVSRPATATVTACERRNKVAGGPPGRSPAQTRTAVVETIARAPVPARSGGAEPVVDRRAPAPLRARPRRCSSAGAHGP